MNNRQLLIALAGVNYGASITSATADTATTPDTLAPGAIGAFYYNSSTGQWELITGSAPSSIAGITEVIMAQGGATGYTLLTTTPISRNGVQVYRAKDYLAPIAEVVHLFYDGTIGAGITVANSTDYTVRITNSTKQQLPFKPMGSSVVTSAASGNTQYSIATLTINDINAKSTGNTIQPAKFPVLAEIVAAVGTRTAFANNATLVNGSTSVAVTAHALAAGTYVKFLGIVYKIVSTTTNAFVIDRAFTGASQTIAASNTSTGSYGTVDPTLVGIRLTSLNPGEKTEFGVADGYIGGNIIYTTLPTYGSGTSSEVLDAEQKAQQYMGYFHPGAPFPERPHTYTVTNETYDLITLTYSNDHNPMNGVDNVQRFQQHLQVAIPHSNSSMSGELLGYLNTWLAAAPGTFANASL